MSRRFVTTNVAGYSRAAATERGISPVFARRSVALAVHRACKAARIHVVRDSDPCRAGQHDSADSVLAIARAKFDELDDRRRKLDDTRSRLERLIAISRGSEQRRLHGAPGD